MAAVHPVPVCAGVGVMARGVKLAVLAGAQAPASSVLHAT